MNWKKGKQPELKPAGADISFFLAPLVPGQPTSHLGIKVTFHHPFTRFTFLERLSLTQYEKL